MALPMTEGSLMVGISTTDEAFGVVVSLRPLLEPLSEASPDDLPNLMVAVSRESAARLVTSRASLPTRTVAVSRSSASRSRTPYRTADLLRLAAGFGRSGVVVGSLNAPVVLGVGRYGVVMGSLNAVVLPLGGGGDGEAGGGGGRKIEVGGEYRGPEATGVLTLTLMMMVFMLSPAGAST